MAKNVNFANSKRNMIDTFKPFFVLLYISGLNYRVFKVKKFIFVFYCICIISVIVSSSYLCCDDHVLVQLWALTEYILAVVILLVYDTRLYEFCKNLQSIDCSLRIKSNINAKTNKKIFLLVFFLWCFRVGFTIIYCFTYICFSSITLYIVSLISPFILDINRVWRYILVDMVRHRLHFLRLRVDEVPGCNFYLHVSENKMCKDDKIKFLLNVYRNIADTADLMMPEIHASILSSIICTVPKLISNVYNLLLVIEGHEPLISVGFLALHSIQTCFFLFSPCLGIEQQIMEVEKIRLSLFHQYIETTDPKTKEDLQTFLQYIEIRQFRSKIWRFIPLDISLPVEIINFCGSSIVVMLNFAHLLD